MVPTVNKGQVRIEDRCCSQSDHKLWLERLQCSSCHTQQRAQHSGRKEKNKQAPINLTACLSENIQTQKPPTDQQVWTQNPSAVRTHNWTLHPVALHWLIQQNMKIVFRPSRTKENLSFWQILRNAVFLFKFVVTWGRLDLWQTDSNTVSSDFTAWIS